MHVRELVELAALLAAHAPAIVDAPNPIPESSLEQYWVASKSRIGRWAGTLKGFDAGKCVLETASRTGCCLLSASVLQEILASEVLTRVWAAVARSSDRRRGADAAEPVAQSVLFGHMEARCRVLTLLVRSPSIDAGYALKLNRLRRRAERWTDMLIGQLIEVDDVAEFAAEPARAREFARDLRDQAHQPGSRYVKSLVLASVRAAFAQGLASGSPNADLNAQIASSTLSAFGPALSDATGVPSSAWLVRLTSFADDTHGAVQELLRSDGSRQSTGSASSCCRRLADRLRGFPGL